MLVFLKYKKDEFECDMKENFDNELNKLLKKKYENAIKIRKEFEDKKKDI